MRHTAAFTLLSLLTLLTLLWTSPTTGHAQDGDDAGADSDADAGTASDAPMQADDDPDAGVEDRIECSCDIIENLGEDGRVHTCTGSFDERVCATFSCTMSNVVSHACENRDVKLCCDMGSRGLYTNLYEDCDYPSCEAGFRAQCDDFGGNVFEGLCGDQDEVVADDDPKGDDAGGFCAVSGSPGGARSAGSSAAMWLLCAVGLGWRRRRQF